MATNTNRPNFYILLDLDPDAPWDQEAFERALSVKRSEWSRQTNGVGQRALEARKSLELLPQIRVVMQNPMQRNAEAREARVQRDVARKKALEELEFRTAKGYITQDDIDELTRDFPLLAREEITQRITVYIVNKPGQQSPNPIQPLAPELQQRVETHLEALGKKDLYELLGLSSSASRAELVTAADRLYNEMVRRPASSETTTKKNLAGDAKSIFSSGETRQRYDASLHLKSPKSLQDALEKLARAVNSKPNKTVVAREIELYLDGTREVGWEDGLALGWFFEEAHKQQWTIQSFPKKQTNETPTTSQTSSTEYTQMQQPQPYNPDQQPFQYRQTYPLPPPPPNPPPNTPTGWAYPPQGSQQQTSNAQFTEPSSGYSRGRTYSPYPEPIYYPSNQARNSKGCVKVLAVFVIGIIVVLVGTYLVGSNLVVPNSPVQHKGAFGAGTSWEGQEYQYNYGQNPASMLLTVETLKKGAFSGTVQWQDFGDTVTKVEGTIVTNVSFSKDTRWKYVLQAHGVSLQLTNCRKGVYLQFTETAFVQGNSVILNSAYYSVVCDGKLSGFWFYPNKPHDGPGGEFSLQEK
jgi:hypothetical protein